MALALSFDPGAVIIAGGTGGIGEGIARRFAEAGLPVLITFHNNEATAVRIKAEIEAAGMRWSVVESVPVHEDIKQAKGRRDEYLANYAQSLRNLAACGRKLDRRKSL